MIKYMLRFQAQRLSHEWRFWITDFCFYISLAYLISSDRSFDVKFIPISNEREFKIITTTRIAWVYHWPLEDFGTLISTSISSSSLSSATTSFLGEFCQPSNRSWKSQSYMNNMGQILEDDNALADMSDWTSNSDKVHAVLTSKLK